jgi:hypothetical protein
MGRHGYVPWCAPEAKIIEKREYPAQRESHGKGPKPPRIQFDYLVRPCQHARMTRILAEKPIVTSINSATERFGCGQKKTQAKRD